MAADKYDGEEDEGRDPAHAGDPQLPVAKQHLAGTFFAPGTKRLYYQRQVQVLTERVFFHWITAAAIASPSEEGSIGSEIEPLRESVVRLLWPKGYRYRAREKKSMLALLDEISAPEFGTGVGRHGETLFDAALPRIGMRPVARDVTAHEGKTWTKTKHNLDRIYELDGVHYGIEIKEPAPVHRCY